MTKKTTKKTTKKSGFFGNWIVKNLLMALIIVVVLIFGSMIFLDLVTQHDKVNIVPDFTNMSVGDAKVLADSAGVRLDVVDSVFVKRLRKGVVFRQNPTPGAQVKKGRRIMLTINAVNAKKITMPNLVGCSLRQAMGEINSRGLFLGRIVYEPDMATNNVLRQLYNGQEIEPGTMIESESPIDLVVGLNANDSQTFVPDVIGLKSRQAVDAIHSKSLNLGRLSFDETVSNYDDSLSAVVYKQIPEFSDSISVNRGVDVRLFLTKNLRKVPVREQEEDLKQENKKN